MPESRELYDAILKGDAKLAISLTKKALEEGCNPLELAGGSMIPAMDEVGRRFACQEYYVPDLLLSGRAMKGALQLVRPLLAAAWPGEIDLAPDAMYAQVAGQRHEAPQADRETSRC